MYSHHKSTNGGTSCCDDGSPILEFKIKTHIVLFLLLSQSICLPWPGCGHHCPQKSELCPEGVNWPLSPPLWNWLSCTVPCICVVVVWHHQCTSQGIPDCIGLRTLTSLWLVVLSLGWTNFCLKVHRNAVFSENAFKHFRDPCNVRHGDVFRLVTSSSLLFVSWLFWQVHCWGSRKFWALVAWLVQIPLRINHFLYKNILSKRWKK